MTTYESLLLALDPRPDASKVPLRTAPHRLNLRFTIDSDVQIGEPRRALEHTSEARAGLNGNAVTAAVAGRYVDESIETLSLPTIPAGRSILEISILFGPRIPAEWCYLLGDFGGAVTGGAARLTAPARTLCCGDRTTQGLAFYGGNVSYRVPIDGPGHCAVRVPRFRNPLIGVSVDGRRCDRIAHSPYVADLGKLGNGRHVLELTAFGNRANSFGPVHNADETDTLSAPSSWRTDGPAWTYEYRLQQTGILSAPILIEVS